jgi:putative PIN family toxin of toxin-antitoxin system
VSEATIRHKLSRIFLDSNVLFSGFHSPTGSPSIIIRHFVEGKLVVVVSQQVLQEVVRTFNKKLPEALPALKRFLLCSPLEVIGDPKPEDVAHWTKLLHEGDAAIIAAAIAAEPDFFVTGDSHFLRNSRVKKESGLQICSPSDLLRNLGLEGTG